MKAGNKLLEMLYPRCCPLCHGIIGKTGEIVCNSCVAELFPIVQPRCMKCGKSITKETGEYCGDCRRYSHEFQQGMGIYPYNGVMRASIEKYKNQGRREYADFYIQALIYYGRAFVDRWKPQCVMGIPMHRTKERIRGFNQSEDLARGVAEGFQLPYCQGLLRPGKEKSQKELSAVRRRRNLRGAFVPSSDAPVPDRILLIDDVYTTGSTIDAASSALKTAGAAEIYFLTLCQGKGL